MGKISKVFYKEIDHDRFSPRKAAEYYFYSSLVGLSDQMNTAYEKCEVEQYKVRGRAVGEAKESGELPTNTDLRNTIFGISSLKNTVVLVTEF